MQKSKFHEAFVQNRRVARHAIDATPARWRAPDAPVDLRTEADPCIRNRSEGRRRHAGRAATPHAARRVVEDSLPHIILSKKYWYLALIAHPANLHVAVVRRADGVVAGPRALVRPQRAALVRAPVPVQIEPAWKSTFGRPTNRRDVFP